MHVYLQQLSRAPLTELARYADTLIKVAIRNVRSSESSKDKVSRSARVRSKSYAHVVMSSDDSGQKNTSDIPPRTENLCYHDRRQSSLPPYNDKILYFWVCFEKVLLLQQCPYTSRLSELLQKRKDGFRWFGGTVRFYQSQLCRGSRSLWWMNDAMRRDDDREGRGRWRNR